MRVGLVLVAVGMAGPVAVWPGVSFGQSLLGNAQDDQGGAVPTPPMVPTPPVAPLAPMPSTPMPAAPMQLTPVQATPIQAAPLSAAPVQAAPVPQVIQATQPPGPVETPVPPVNQDDGQAQAQGTQAAPVSGDQAGTAAGAPPGSAPTGQPAGGQPVAPAQAAPDTADSTPPPVPNDWVPEKTAEIGILDKVGGGASTVSVPVGGQTTSGNLQISVLACVARPPNEVPDDAVFLDIQPTDDSSGGPIFRGWMIRSIPGATVVGNASETLRVVSCT